MDITLSKFIWAVNYANTILENFPYDKILLKIQLGEDEVLHEAALEAKLFLSYFPQENDLDISCNIPLIELKQFISFLNSLIEEYEFKDLLSIVIKWEKDKLDVLISLESLLKTSVEIMCKYSSFDENLGIEGLKIEEKDELIDFDISEELEDGEIRDIMKMETTEEIDIADDDDNVVKVDDNGDDDIIVLPPPRKKIKDVTVNIDIDKEDNRKGDNNQEDDSIAEISIEPEEIKGNRFSYSPTMIYREEEADNSFVDNEREDSPSNELVGAFPYDTTRKEYMNCDIGNCNFVTDCITALRSHLINEHRRFKTNHEMMDNPQRCPFCDVLIEDGHKLLKHRWNVHRDYEILAEIN